MQSTEVLPARRQPARGRMLRAWASTIGYPLGFGVLLVLLWQVAVDVLQIPQYLLPSPSVIGEALLRNFGALLMHSAYTMLETMLGFVLATLFGFVCGVGIAYSRFMQTTIYPVLIVLNTIPKIALAPLILVWFGIGLVTNTTVVFLIAFFPIVVTTVDGLRAYEPEMVELARSLQASGWDEFWKVRFPSALPSILSGLKVSISLAVGGSVVAGFISGRLGLGTVVISAVNVLNISGMMAALVLLSVLAVILFAAMTLIERLVVPWSFHQEE